MMNDVVHLENITKATSITLSKPDANYLKQKRFTRSLVVLLLLIAATVIFTLKNQWHNMPVVVGVYAFLLTGWFVWLWLAKKAFHNQGYGLREHDVIIKKGWLFEKWQVVPLNKIQHSQMTVNPLERWLNLCTIQLYTAGTADASINGLDKQAGEKIKAWLAAQMPLAKIIPAVAENELGDDAG